MRIWEFLLSAARTAIVISLSALPAAAAPAAKDLRTLRIGIDALNPPFSSNAIDQPSPGFDIDIARALCDRMKAKCSFVASTRGALLADLLARKSDAVVASLTIADEAKKTVDFTDKYHSAAARFVVARTSSLTDVSPESLRGKSVGAREGTRFATYLTETYGSKGAIVKLYKTDAEAQSDLRNGHLAAILGGAIQLYGWLDGGPGGRCCRFMGPEIRNPKILGEGAGIAVRKEDPDLRDMLNRALADILRDGTYEKINAMYFNFLIY